MYFPRTTQTFASACVPQARRTRRLRVLAKHAIASTACPDTVSTSSDRASAIPSAHGAALTGVAGSLASAAIPTDALPLLRRVFHVRAVAVH